MEPITLKKLRIRQIIVTNGLALITLAIYVMAATVFSITPFQSNLLLGAIFFSQAMYGLVRRNSTKSFIPTFEKVAIYEKQKMGIEWKKQRKTNFISLFFLSGVMLVNSFLTQELSHPVFQTDIIFPLLVIFLAIFAILNIFLLIHIKKVDRAEVTTDLKGYTCNSTIIGIIAGVIIAIFLFLFVISYVMIKN